VDDAWQDSFWQELTQHKIDFLRTQVAPFLGYLAGVDVAAATFTNKVERLKLEILTDGAKPETLKSIAEDVSRLPNFVFRYSQRPHSANLCLSPQLQTATPEQLNQVIADLAAQMKNRRSRSRFFDNSKEAFLNELKDNLKTASYLDICVGYFNLSGWWLIDELINGFVNPKNNRCRLLIGMKPRKEEDNNKLYGELIKGLSSVPKMRLVRFANQLKIGEIQLKLVSDVHAKLYLIYQNRSKLPTTAFLGSSNLTYSGLNRPGELNARFDSPEDCQELQGWFNNQWDSKEAIDFSQEFAELILKDESKFRENIIEELGHFFIEWQVDYLDCDGKMYRLDDYISFNPHEGEHEIHPNFEPFIKNLIDEFGARYICLPYDNNPNCETLMDILNRDEDSDDYCDRWLYESLDYLKYLFEKDD
jgi:HKD family nuclease